MTTRRRFLGGCGIAGAVVTGVSSPAAGPAPDTFRYCLNTGTLQSYKLAIVEIVEVAAKAGYHAVEPWMSLLTTYQRQGGSLPELRRRIVDLGLQADTVIHSRG